MSTPPTKYMTLKDVAEHLGVHAKTVTSMIKAGELDALQVRGRYRVHPDAIAKFEAANKYRYQDLSANPYNHVA